MFLLFEFCYGTPPSCLKVMVGGWVAYRILVSAPGPLVFELIGTWYVLGIGGLGPGLDNNKYLRVMINKSRE